jgi:crotonobetainyl-CoA:carnitine CoA-transferase CaiB-like acyl-CoA transferase
MLHEKAVKSLQNIRVLTLAVNVPGPAAAARLRQLGATVVKVEPPTGDPLAQFCPAWYKALAVGQEVVRLNLKDPGERAQLDRFLEQSDCFLTATRPAALERLSLSWSQLHARYPRLSQVAIVGFPTPKENIAGHDLTYQAAMGLITPPQLPRTLLADLACAERVVSTALALLLARERYRDGGYEQVSLVEAIEPFADPLRYGITAPGQLLGGGLPGYNLYGTQQGWIAVAALEPHFWQRLERELDLSGADQEALQRVFLTRTATDWETWAAARDLPMAAVRDSPFPPAC